MYGWPLNNTGLNYTFYLYMDFFFPVVIPQYCMIRGWLHRQIFDWAVGCVPSLALFSGQLYLKM